MSRIEHDMIICAECGSPFRQGTSRMKELCPECAHILYGYANCTHQFQNGKCTRCLWNGARSAYIQALLKWQGG